MPDGQTIASKCVTPTFARDIAHHIFRHAISHSFPTMSGTSVCADKRIRAAAVAAVEAMAGGAQDDDFFYNN